MITATTGPSGILGTLTTDSGAVKSQLDTALEQESTGLVSQSYAGLGANAQISLDLNPQVAHLKAWQNNIASATSRLAITQSVLTQINQIATNFYAQSNNINNVGVSEAGTIAASAKQALQQVAQLLNTKDGNVYIFAGQDTGNAPIPDTSAATLSAAALAVPQTAAPFSATISSTVPTVEVGEGQSVQIGLLANQNTLSVSTGATTTGSYTRDIMQGLATLAGLTPGAAAQTGAEAAGTLLSGAITALSDEQGALGEIQSGLTARQTALSATQSALTDQVSNVQDVDAAATITKVQSLQTQLQASYQLIAGAKSLTLSNFLGTP
jgi:flagellar hook-associated protein 3 FlgL